MMGKPRVPREMENQIGRTKTDGDGSICLLHYGAVHLRCQKGAFKL